MTDEELARALIGIYAYDTGSVDSGVHDEPLRARCIQRLHELTKQKPEGYMQDAGIIFLTRTMREHFFTEESIKQGYGAEDAKHFIEWLSDRMDFDV